MTLALDSPGVTQLIEAELREGVPTDLRGCAGWRLGLCVLLWGHRSLHSFGVQFLSPLLLLFRMWGYYTARQPETGTKESPPLEVPGWWGQDLATGSVAEASRSTPALPRFREAQVSNHSAWVESVIILSSACSSSLRN